MEEQTEGVRTIVLTAAVVAFSLLGDSFLYVALPLEYQSLGLGLVSVGVLLSVNRFIRFFSNTLAGYVYGRYPVKTPLLAAIVVGALVNLSYGFVAGFLAFLVVRAVWGVAWSFLRFAGYLTVVSNSEERRRGGSMGLYQAVSSLGSLCGALLGGYMLDQLGFRLAAIILASVSTIGIPIALSLKRGRKPQVDEVGTPTPINVGLLVGDARMLGIGVGTMMNSLLLGSLLVSTLSLYLVESIGREGVSVLGATVGIATLSGFLLMIRLLSRLVIGPVIGSLSDRFSRQNTITLLFLGGAASMAVLSQSGSISLMTLAVILSFFSAAGLGVVLTTEAVGIAASQAKGGQYVMISYTNWIDLGSALGPLIAYVLRLGIPFRTMYLGASALLLIYTLFHVRKRKAISSRLGEHVDDEIRH